MSITAWARPAFSTRTTGSSSSIHQFFTLKLASRVVAWGQNPLLLTALVSEPQPDIILLAPRADFYTRSLPEPSDVRLLIEVADSSLAYDRRTKIPLYARAGITEVWLVDVEAGRVHLYRQPSAQCYADVRMPAHDERFSALAFPDVTLTLRDLVGE
jgi:Uma2 family endonuclease